MACTLQSDTGSSPREAQRDSKKFLKSSNFFLLFTAPSRKPLGEVSVSFPSSCPEPGVPSHSLPISDCGLPSAKASSVWSSTGQQGQLCGEVSVAAQDSDLVDYAFCPIIQGDLQI